MKRWKIAIATVIAVLGIGMASALPATDAAAINLFPTCNNSNKDTAVCKSSKDNANGLAKTITDLMFYFVGILAVIMIIAGGIRYVISSGDASKVKAAKDTIMYSVIGLIVAILAWTIVSYIVTKV